MNKKMMKNSRDQASDHLRNFAKNLRSNTTKSEQILWQEIRSKKLGIKFRRQVIIGKWVADFVCLEKKLIIELDGKYHIRPGQPEIDSFRDKKLEEMGYRILRIEARRVFSDLTTVVAEIETALSGFIFKN
jgi:ATP-dependent DNA helicase RecG